MKKLVFGSVSGLPPRPSDAQPFVHRPQERDQGHGVEVEHRLGPAAEAAGGIVAGDGQDVLETLGGVTPGGRFQAVAVHVLAGQVQDHAASALGHQAAEPVGREHRPAARIVGDRDPADPRIGQQVPGEGRQIARRIDRLQAARGDHLRAVIEPAGGEHLPVCHAFVGGNHVGRGPLQSTLRDSCREAAVPAARVDMASVAVTPTSWPAPPPCWRCRCSRRRRSRRRTAG